MTKLCGVRWQQLCSSSSFIQILVFFGYPDLDLPVMVQNKNLETLLDSLFERDTLKTWQIYEDYSGHVIVKLKFCGQQGHGSVINTPSFYKRKSASQIQRDNQRAKDYRNKHAMQAAENVVNNLDMHFDSGMVSSTPGIISSQLPASPNLEHTETDIIPVRADLDFMVSDCNDPVIDNQELVAENVNSDDDISDPRQNEQSLTDSEDLPIYEVSNKVEVDAVNRSQQESGDEYNSNCSQSEHEFQSGKSDEQHVTLDLIKETLDGLFNDCPLQISKNESELYTDDSFIE